MKHRPLDLCLQVCLLIALAATAAVSAGCSDDDQAAACTSPTDCSGGQQCLVGVCVACVLDEHCGGGMRCDLSGERPVCVARQDGSPPDAAAADAATEAAPADAGVDLGACTDGETRACYTGPAATRGAGACKDGVETCVKGAWGGTCAGEVLPAASESCNGKDDDCDGYTDNAAAGAPAALTAPCYKAAAGCSGGAAGYSCQGACKAGQELCVTGTWLPCAGATYPTTEICDNGVDEDCDGTKDDGCKKVCVPFEKRCSGGDVEVCNSAGTGWDFREACLGGCAKAACTVGGCVPFSLSGPAKLRGDASSTALITSGPIVSFDGTPVPDGALFTVSSNKGTIQAADADAVTPGVQVRAVDGRIDFALAAEAAAAAGSMEVSAVHAAAAKCAAKITLAVDPAHSTHTAAEDFTSDKRRDAADTASWDTALGRALSAAADVGGGGDGDLTVAAGSSYNISQQARPGRIFPDAVAYPVSALAAAGATLTGGVGGLAVGDEVLLINLQGDKTSSGNVGRREIKTIAAIDYAANKLHFTSALNGIYGATTSNSALTGQKIVVQRIPHYKKVTVAGTLSADSWNGTRGGLLVFKASGGVTVTGTVTMAGNGYRAASARSGESYNGGYNALWGVKANKGGGGNSNSAMTSALPSPSCSWYHCCGYHYNYYRFYAAGGGYGTVGSRISSTHHTSCSGKTDCYQSYTSAVGQVYGAPALGRWYLGSAGGGGGYTRRYCYYSSDRGNLTSYPYAGGNGGGVIVIWSTSIAVSGSVTASGLGGASYSGGGAGGTILLGATALNMGSKKVTARGGTAGGAGRIRLDAFTLSGATDPAHHAGFGGASVVLTTNLNPGGKALASARVDKRVEDLSGGAASYALSADGGKTWSSATPGKDVTFSAGADLRLKVTLTNASLATLALMGVQVAYVVK